MKDKVQVKNSDIAHYPLQQPAKQLMDFSEQQIKDQDEYSEVQNEYAEMNKTIHEMVDYFFESNTNEQENKVKNLIQRKKLNHKFSYTNEAKKFNQYTEYNNYEKFYENFYKLRETMPDQDDDGTVSIKRRLFYYMSAVDPQGNYLTQRQKRLISLEKRGIKPDERIVQQENYSLDNDKQYQKQNAIKYFQSRQREVLLNTQLSMEAQEEIYLLYKKGWSVQDLMYRYGISSQRVKATIWLVNYYYEEIVPHTHPQELRKEMEQGLENEKKYPPIDFGLDILQLGTENEQLKMSKFKQKLKSKAKDTILKFDIDEPEQRHKEAKDFEFVDKKVLKIGQKVVKIKDLIVYRGSGVMDVNPMFKKLIRYHKNSDYLPKKVKDRLELGPRMATLSYKTSGKPRAKHTAFKDWGPVLKKKEEDVNFMDEFIKGINHAHESSELYKQGKRVIPLRRF